MITFEPIGVVRTPFESPEDAPRQGLDDEVTGTIVIDRAYEAGLAGLAAGDRIDVVWVADRADRSVLRVRAGNRGVFATRSPDRPNPICVSPCTVCDVAGRRLAVTGVDAVDGSPVLDLKAGFR